MNECGALSGSVLVREELCHGHNISRKTIERGLFLLDLYFEETIVHLWRRLNEIYSDLSTDAYVDGPHIPREGAGRGAYTAAGEGGGSVQLQDQFMIAQLVGSRPPISVEVYRGNLNDSPQYADFVPQLMFMLNQGSMIIMDHGGVDQGPPPRDQGQRYGLSDTRQDEQERHRAHPPRDRRCGVRRKRDNVCGLLVNSVTRTLGTLMVIVSPGYVRLTPSSKTVREIFSLFGLEEPVAGRITLS